MSNINKILVIGMALGIWLIRPDTAFCRRGELDEQVKLRQEIQILNLLSGLYLSDEQMEYLIDKGRQLQAIREEAMADLQRQSSAQTETLKELKQELEEYDTDGEVSQDVAKEVHQSNLNMRKLKVESEEKADAILTEVKSRLSSTQLHIIEEFVPCLVPPKGPARFGQAASAEGGEQKTRQLEMIRAMSDDDYQQRKDKLVERALETARLYAQKGEEFDEEALEAKLLAIYNEARALSDIDFGWKKDQLALEIKECIFPEHKIEDVDQRIQQFLLSPAAVEILKEELAKKAQGSVITSE